VGGSGVIVELFVEGIKGRALFHLSQLLSNVFWGWGEQGYFRCRDFLFEV